MISAIVFMNIKGDVLIYRIYKHDVGYYLLSHFIHAFIVVKK